MPALNPCLVYLALSESIPELRWCGPQNLRMFVKGSDELEVYEAYLSARLRETTTCKL